MSTREHVRLRRARPADAEGIRVIRNAAIRDSLAIWTSREQDAQEARDWLAPLVRRGTALVVVEAAPARLPPGTTGSVREGRVLGFAVASPWQAYEGYARTVEDSLYLTPGAQGRGLGSRLLTALIDAARQAGDRTMVAQIESGNAASVAVHARAGFRVVGTVPEAGEKNGQVLDLTLMSLRL